MPGNAKVREALARALLGLGRAAPRPASQADPGRLGDRRRPAPTRSAWPPRSTWPPATPTPRPARSPGSTAIGPDDPATLELKARVLKAPGRPAEAVAALERAFDGAGADSPDAAEARPGRCPAPDVDLGEPEAAERLARRVAGLGPAGPVVLAEWPRLDRPVRRGRVGSTRPPSATRSAAREAARSALALASMNREPRWVDLADRLLDRRDRRRARSTTELAYARASLRHLQGRLEEAVRLYDDLAARSAAESDLLNNCAWILSEELGRPADGLGPDRGPGRRGRRAAAHARHPGRDPAPARPDRPRRSRDLEAAAALDPLRRRSATTWPGPTSPPAARPTPPGPSPGPRPPASSPSSSSPPSGPSSPG